MDEFHWTEKSSLNDPGRALVRIYATVGITPSLNLTFCGATLKNRQKPDLWDTKRSKKMEHGAFQGLLPGTEIYQFGTLVSLLGEDTAQGISVGS